MPLFNTQILLSGEASNARPYYNYLINAPFEFSQRVTPGSATIVAADTYGPDMWKSSTENTSLSCLRVDTNGALEASLASRYYEKYIKNTTTGKFLIAQILEGSQTIPLTPIAPLGGRTVTFQIKMKASTSQTMRIGLVQLDATGTIDTIPALVSSWGANSTDPTLGTHLSRLTPVSIPLGANGTISGTGVSCSVTTSWQQFGGTYNLLTGFLNLAVAIWPDSQFSATQIVSLGEPGLYDGDSLRDWLPRFSAQELRLCQRYYEKTYDSDSPPATVTDIGAWGGAAVNTSELYTLGHISFKVTKRVIPTITLYSSATGATGVIRELGGAAADVGAQAIMIGQNGYRVNSSGTTFTATRAYRWHYTAEAGL